MGRASVIRQSAAGDSVVCDIPVAISVSVGAADQLLVAAPSAVLERRILFIQNTHATQLLWVTLDGATAVAASPSVSVPAGQTLRFDSNYVPNGAIRAIAAGAATTVTVITG